jgi:hypothetical protein
VNKSTRSVVTPSKNGVVSSCVTVIPVGINLALQPLTLFDEALVSVLLASALQGPSQGFEWRGGRCRGVIAHPPILDQRSIGLKLPMRPQKGLSICWQTVIRRESQHMPASR